MNTFAELLPSPSRAGASPGHSGAEPVGPVQLAANNSEMPVLQKVVNRRESVQTNLQARRALDASPRVAAQAKLASALSNAPVQRRCGPLKKIDPLTGTSPQESIEENAVIQSKSMNATTGAVAQREPANRTGLPDSLKSGVEAMSGLSMDDVRVHYNSDKPAQLQAHAYTQGSDIHVAPGQEQHLAHEAWHVVQQKQGRVAPTAQLRGVALNDDKSLEKEADTMGAQAFQMKAEKPETASLSLEQSSSSAGSSVFQMARKRRKEFKNERQRLATAKRNGSGEQVKERIEEEAAYEDDFDQYLTEGMQLILGEDLGGTGYGVRFGSFSEDTKESPAKQKYDIRYWDVIEEPSGANQDQSGTESDREDSESDDEPEYKLVLKSGVKPSDAIDSLFDNLEKWALDCAEAIQVARWYAMRHALGAEKFNWSVKGMEFALKSHDSTGLHSTGIYTRTNEEGEYERGRGLKFKRNKEDVGRHAKASAEAIIREAPVGTRFLLTADDEDAAGTDFENENVVKIGPDEYAGHPMGIGTLDWMIEEVAKTALDLDEEDDITPELEEELTRMRKKIYISEIEFIRKR